MVSNEEIRIALESKRRGVDSEEFLEIMQVPYEWTGNSYLFDFSSMPVETLSNYIHYIFRQMRYHLDERTLDNGIYLNVNVGGRSFPNPSFKFKVEIYHEGHKTYLEISRVFFGWYMSFCKKIYGKNYLNSELNRLADKIKYLKPSVVGYFICDKCGGYFELNEGELPDDFSDKCECRGTLKYILNREQPNIELVKKYNISYIKQTRHYLNILVNIISFLILFFILLSFLFNTHFLGGVIFLLLLLYVLVLIRSDF
jgi:hypothetical protein